jgi:hypothetical protein
MMAFDLLGLQIPPALAQGQHDRPPAPQPIARSGQRGQPVKLKIETSHAKALRFLRIIGVPDGFRFSRGFSVSDGSSWYVAASDASAVELIPPEGFFGAVRLEIDFFVLNNASGKPSNSGRQSYLVRIGEAVSSAALAAPAPDTTPTVAVAKDPSEANREKAAQPYLEEAEALLRAKDLLDRGDIAAARLLYEDLAIAGSAQGAFALARSYDPAFLRSMGAIGMQPDLELARKWYKKAAELGNGEASQRLTEMR